MKQELVLCCE